MAFMKRALVDVNIFSLLFFMFYSHCLTTISTNEPSTEFYYIRNDGDAPTYWQPVADPQSYLAARGYAFASAFSWNPAFPTLNAIRGGAFCWTRRGSMLLFVQHVS